MRKECGFGLIGVLIACVIISSGLGAYMSLQRGIFREASLASGRAAATELALSKLEDLRGFTVLNTTTGQYAFQDIAANAGGTIASGNVTVNNTTFSRNWTITNYWYTTINSPPTTTAPTGNPPPSFKLITVTVAWTDQNGAAQTLALSSIIAAAEPRLLGTIFN